MDGSRLPSAPGQMRSITDDVRPMRQPTKVAAPDLAQFDLRRSGCDASLAALLEPQTAIALSAVPHSLVGGRLIVATARPERAAEIQRALPQHQVVIAASPLSQITDAIGQLYGVRLARAAETRAPEDTSARVWTGRQLSLRLAVPLVIVVLAALLAPLGTYLACLAVTIAVFSLNMALKLASLATLLRHDRQPRVETRVIPLHREPVITLMVPLFNEDDVAGVLLERISALSYPKSKLDVIFILEASDSRTAAALRACKLPDWARALTVPPGHPQTKPRALNYALPFARGTVIGIYDAEDRPERDQLTRVAERFAQAPPDVVCLQGQLDYYNASHNWMSRCFTIEYATWFRLLLPGVARLGLAVPLGGTTLFIKRDALVRVGAWDAHNVTEDAELGIRLYRHSYRTELLETTTFEEANSAIWPWIKQRSRWLKGYAITWATLMRHPLRLWRDVGALRFLGLQAQFAGTILGFVTAPLLWTLPVLVAAGPNFITPQVITCGAAFFLTASIATLWINWRACAAAHLRCHRFFVPTMLAYYPLATVAALWALVDLAIRPFYWAKTAHGCYGSAEASTASARSLTSKA